MTNLIVIVLDFIYLQQFNDKFVYCVSWSISVENTIYFILFLIFLDLIKSIWESQILFVRNVFKESRKTYFLKN